jgi:signal transduction histidine kinase/sensor domain CHASE-containing protein
MKPSLRSGSSIAVFRTIAAALAGLALFLPLSIFIEGKLLEEQKTKHLAELTPYGSNLSLMINTRLALANSLEAFVRAGRKDSDFRSKFNSFAEGLYVGNSGVRAIQVFPPEGLELVFPLRTNEKVAVGSLKALLADTRPEVVSDLAHAIETRHLTLSGPYELKQGGLGLIARKAIYDKDAFWGFAVIVLDIPPMLEQAGIQPQVGAGLLLALKDDKGKVFSGDPKVFDSSPITVPIQLPEHQWTFAAIPSGGWANTFGNTFNWFRFTGLLVVLLVAILVYVTSSHGVRLRAAVGQATEDLRDSEGKLKEAQVLGKIGSWEFDSDKKTISWSDQVYELYNRDPRLGPPSQAEEAAYYSPETAARIQEYVRLASGSDQSVAYDFDAIIPGKGIRHFTAIIGARKNSDGSVAKLFGTVQDITERKQAALEIESLNVNLERRVAARTAELEAANRDLESFSYSVSHDLRAPLRAISGFSRILAEEHSKALDQEGVRLCGIIGKNAENMGSLIDNLLEFSRLGRANLTLVPVNMADLVNSVFMDITTKESRERIEFSVGTLPEANADPVLLRQVWINLISNAVKFSKEREKSVIAIDCEMRAGIPWYRIRDNGAGFDMKYADKLFGVFQRLHGQIEFEGTGVGLAIVKKIINRHGGEIKADSRPDEGATFSFTLSKGA